MSCLKDSTLAVFTKLDCRRAYYLVRIQKGDEWKTTFHTIYDFLSIRSCCWVVQYPATIQHFINNIYRDMLDRFVVIYLDNILIFSRSQDLHNHHMHCIMERLSQNHLYVKLEK